MTKNKAIGWGGIPREIFTDDFINERQRLDWMMFCKRLLESMINSGTIPQEFNKTRLLCLNKKPNEIPSTSAIRPIQIADCFKLSLEILV